MAGFYSKSNIKKTRKPHKCFGCCRTIPAGSPAIYIASNEGGDFGTWYLCPECDDYASKYMDSEQQQSRRRNRREEDESAGEPWYKYRYET